MGARVLVTGAGTGLGNNLIRSLRAADAGLVILGCHDDRFELKKSAAERHYLLPAGDARGFAGRLRRLVRTERVDVIVPTSDRDVVAVSRHRLRLPARVFLPRHRVIALCGDKYTVHARLRARGVPTPRTYPLRGLADVGRVFRRLGRVERAWCRARRGSGSRGAAPVTSAAQARAWIDYWWRMRGVPPREFTLAEYLPGRDFACQMLWQQGRLVLAKTFERVSYFAGGGQPSGVSSVAALAKSVAAPHVVEVCTAAIRALDPRVSGMFCLDLKENAAGVPCVTEINAGRASLSTGLYDLVGKHNMADLYVRLALGQPVDLGETYDVAPDHYLVRDVDTLPAIIHAEELFEGITDLR